MNEELKTRINVLHSDLMNIIRDFRPRYEEPFIIDNIYKDVLGKIKAKDPTMLIELYPEIRIENGEQGYSIQIIYQRIQ